jgi:hypothetical protein
MKDIVFFFLSTIVVISHVFLCGYTFPLNICELCILPIPLLRQCGAGFGELKCLIKMNLMS